MGLLLPQIEYTIKTCKENNITGSILSLGRLDYFINFEQFEKLMIKYELAYYVNTTLKFFDSKIDTAVKNLIEQHKHMSLSKQTIIAYPCISDTLFYTALGFEIMDSIDVQGTATIIFNLNNKGIIDIIDKRYNLVIDAGVMEHVFDIRSVFLNSTDLLTPEGYIIHILPANNTMDHGFYQFSPTLFNDYYLTNKYEIINNIILELLPNKYSRSTFFVDRWDYYRLIEYDPYFFGKNSFGQLSDNIYYVMMCAKKQINSLRDQAPHQYAFAGNPIISPWYCSR